MGKFFRTLFRVVDYSSEKDIVRVIIPGRDINEVVELKYSSFPVSLQNKLAPNYRFHAVANFGVENLEDLVVRDFEGD